MVIAGLTGKCLVVDQFVLKVRHLITERPGRVALRIQVKVAADQRHEALGISRVVDRKGIRHSQPAGFFTQNPHASRVERRHPHRARSRPYQFNNTLAHFTSGFIGEGDGHNLARPCVLGGK